MITALSSQRNLPSLDLYPTSSARSHPAQTQGPLDTFVEASRDSDLQAHNADEKSLREMRFPSSVANGSALGVGVGPRSGIPGLAVSGNTDGAMLAWNPMGSTRELSPEQRIYVQAAIKYASQPEFQKGIDPAVIAIAQEYLDKGKFVTGEIDNVAQYERSKFGNEWITLNPANAGLDNIYSTGRQVSKVLANFQENRIDEKTFDRQVQSADRMGEVALANLAAAIMHEATHAHLARTGQEVSELADETTAYHVEALFLNNVHKHSSTSLKPQIESLINSAFSDAWSEEGVRIHESFRPR